MKKEIENVLEQFEDIIVKEKTEFESFDGSEIIEGEVSFISGWKLEFMEFSSSNKHKYRFHLMDENNDLVVRWDTAPHHNDLENFPFHKHLEGEVEPTDELEGKELIKKACEKVVENL